VGEPHLFAKRRPGPEIRRPARICYGIVSIGIGGGPQAPVDKLDSCSDDRPVALIGDFSVQIDRLRRYERTNDGDQKQRRRMTHKKAPYRFPPGPYFLNIARKGTEDNLRI
jgi:hypothetical protein